MKFKGRSPTNEEGPLDLALGVLLGFGVGLCVISLAAALIVAFAPQRLPEPLLAMFGVPSG